VEGAANYKQNADIKSMVDAEIFWSMEVVIHFAVWLAPTVADN
jgi:hypothetical protein